MYYLKSCRARLLSRFWGWLDIPSWSLLDGASHEDVDEDVDEDVAEDDVDEEGDDNSRSSWSTAFLIILENLDAFSIVFSDISIEKYLGKSKQIKQI